MDPADTLYELYNPDSSVKDDDELVEEMSKTIEKINPSDQWKMFDGLKSRELQRGLLRGMTEIGIVKLLQSLDSITKQAYLIELVPRIGKVLRHLKSEDLELHYKLGCQIDSGLTPAEHREGSLQEFYDSKKI